MDLHKARTMDLLKAELERKKQRTSELVAKAGGERGGRRFVRRGEAAKLEREERLKNQADLTRCDREHPLFPNSDNREFAGSCTLVYAR